MRADTLCLVVKPEHHLVFEEFIIVAAARDKSSEKDLRELLSERGSSAGLGSLTLNGRWWGSRGKASAEI